MQISQTSYRFNTLQTKRNNYMTPQNTAFKGSAPEIVIEKVLVLPESSKSKFFAPVKKFFKPMTDSWHKGMDKVTTSIAKGTAKILEIKPVEKLIDKTKNNDYLVSHLTVLTSLVLSGFYMKKTMENKDLEEAKKKTLAINQGAVLVLSTALSYTFDRYAKKHITQFSDNFVLANAGEDAKMIDKYKVGIKAAASMMIFGIMYRFIAPVAVTPVANHIGNKIQDKKDKERMAKHDKQI